MIKYLKSTNKLSIQALFYFPELNHHDKGKIKDFL